MTTSNLNELAPATLAALGKAVSDAAKANRANLAAGEHGVCETVTVSIAGTVKVAEDYGSHIVAKAKPWNLLAAALEVANQQLAAAGVAGIDMAKVVEAAELVDPAAVKAAKGAAEAEVSERKAPTWTECKGAVRVKAKAELVGAALTLAA